VKNAVSKKTEKVLMRVLRYLEEEPKRLEMGRWGEFLTEEDEETNGVGVGESQPLPPCKTVSCLGGTCLLVSKAGRDFLKENGCIKENAKTCSVEFPGETVKVATKILGITDEQAENLFSFKEWSWGEDNPSGWPKKFSRRYEEAKTARGRFLATKARVLDFIRTGL